ncbi:hypothetical protein [Streptomyces sp. V4I2]|uniref:hypothetical protein n=1 Tax=Streptomyces sp. V4I2 TaxID=3042280 RepID=UPI00277E01DF|nr:hypothetical protein [Streptomyces sp. V4I2]MDQ1044857.1 hypothetical protein [Streptomyces sp. V4I2]
MSATRREVVRDVVADTAPGELVLLDGMRSLSDRHVTDVLKRRGSHPDTLGFGLTDAVVLVTPVVWLVVDEVVRRGVGAATDSALARLGAPLRRLLRRSDDDADTVPALTAPQLDAVHGRVLELAADAGMERGTAQGLADAVVSRLARETGSGAAPDERSDPDEPVRAAR